MYRVFRDLSNSFDAEWVHGATLKMLSHIPAVCFRTPRAEKPVRVMGLDFKHPVGLAAGFDKDGRHLDALAKLGFSSIELGTVTPKPQEGNAKPRLFRIPKVHALINRMGFNNAGVDALVKQLDNTSFSGVLGISIGPNKRTTTERVWDDYKVCLERVYAYADYIAVNVSSPNTPGLRALQSRHYFSNLMTKLRAAQVALADTHGQYVPVVVKLSPDESNESLQYMLDELVTIGLDGVILTNTTMHRSSVRGLRFANEVGGVSGRPLASRAGQCLELAKACVGDDLVLIASGGIDTPKEAQARMKAGASLIQVYSGLVYEGPSLVRRLVKGLDHTNQKD
jgi:dihydroorotate dehydrogenase